MMNTLMRGVTGVGVLALAVALAVPACTSDDPASGGTNNNTADGGSTPTDQVCAPNSRVCKGDNVVTTCAADGKSSTDAPCAAGERCSNGACAATTSVNTCQDATTALRRTPTGTFEVVKCPDNTVCTGAGVCKGAFIVGSSQCVGVQGVATSADGFTQTVKACTGTQLCVSTGDQNGVPSADCKDSECVPGTPNLAFCGNPKATSSTDLKALTKCVETPVGYKLITTLCPGTTNCTPGTAANNNTGQAATGASCAGNCLPGTSRCTGNGIAVCDASGNWSTASTPCATGTICFAKAGDPSKAVCGDPACAVGTGACDGSDFRACDANGKLGTAAACTTGNCQATGNNGSGLCVAECTDGEQRCVGNNSTAYQTCVSGRWSATSTTCAAGAACRDYVAATGKRATLCGGDCTPNDTECTTATGDPGDEAVRTCDATGKWGAPTACSIGRCQQGGGGAAACVADCVPNSFVCSGNQVGVAGTPYAGRTGYEQCSAKGLLEGNVVGCTGGALCRTKNGRAIVPAGATSACIECVGSGITGGNEDNLTDSRCSNAGGTSVGGAGAQVCSATNTWAAAGVTACANGCTAPKPRSGPSAPVCAKTGQNNYRTETYFSSRRRGSCQNSRWGGTPIACGNVPDCCSSQCDQPVPASPAYCDAQ